MQNYTRC